MPGLAENSKIRPPKVAAVVAFAGQIRASPAAVDHEIFQTRSPHRAPPPWPARVSRGWPETSPMDKTRLAKKRVETTQFGLHKFWGMFLGVWCLK